MGTLARYARQIADLFLGDVQTHAFAGVKQRIEQFRQAARYAGVRSQQAVVFRLADELADALVQLVQQVAVKRNAVVQQPVKGGDGQIGRASCRESVCQYV